MKSLREFEELLMANKDIRLPHVEETPHHFSDAWSEPWTEAQIYAVEAYAELLKTICPGGTGHQGKGAGAEYCDGCIAEAIARAFEAGAASQKVR